MPALCNLSDCTEFVSLPSRVGYNCWQPCEPGEESGWCAKHAPKLLPPEEEEASRRALAQLIDHLASKIQKGDG